ncbi:MAG: glycosyltransferase [Tolypothrix carrinoi HA7290-LM1]|jgi:glycosyltransferase involved in cell wall biosynthesis|nr:glycosyltransferase [Tolypothrix carrinoi HA7290-LM1]
MPKISVIIPVYNGEKTIEATINSVLQQTFDDFELIIINASSTDSTLEIISQIQDERIKVFTYNRANVAVNRNRGFNQSKCEFVTFLDADDLWTADKLEAQYKILQENPQAGVVYSLTDAIDENSKFLCRWSYATWTGDVYTKLLLANFIGSGSNVMVRSKALKEVGDFDESLTNAQDLDMWLRLAKKYEFISIKKVQIFYRISANSMSSNILGMEKSYLQIIEKACYDERAASYQYLKQYSIANLYKYLGYKALEASPGQQKPLQVAQLIWKSIRYDPPILLKPVIYKALLKLAVITLLPTNMARLLFTNFPKIFNTITLLGYAKIY